MTDLLTRYENLHYTVEHPIRTPFNDALAVFYVLLDFYISLSDHIFRLAIFHPGNLHLIAQKD